MAGSRIQNFLSVERMPVARWRAELNAFDGSAKCSLCGLADLDLYGDHVLNCHHGPFMQQEHAALRVLPAQGGVS